MSCSPFDLRDYFLKELPENERRQVEAHVRNCLPCREEMDRLDLTQAALFSLRDEEIPQRVAFVSDAVFEPSRWRRGWAALWNSGPRLGFASAAMLSAALTVFALTRPAPVAPAGPAAPTAKVAYIPMPEADIQARIDAAVARAMHASEQKQAEQTKALMADLESSRQRLTLAAEEYDVAVKREAQNRTLAYSAEGERQ